MKQATKHSKSFSSKNSNFIFSHLKKKKKTLYFKFRIALLKLIPLLCAQYHIFSTSHKHPHPRIDIIERTHINY